MERLRVALIVSFVFAVGCAQMPNDPFPATHVYEAAIDPDKQAWVCGEYQIIDAERLQFRHTRDLPIGNCNGVFGFHGSQKGHVLSWARRAIQHGKEQCRSGKK